MNARRSRFTVTATPPEASGRPERRVVLAYDAQGAKNYYAARGWTVSSVRRGDFRQARKPSTGARPLPTAIRQAADMLGIAHPVKVRISNRQGGCHGQHSAVPTGGAVRRSGRRLLFPDTATGWCHEIMVKGHLTAQQMGETLWHELAHALQFERDCLSLGLSPSDSMRHWHSAYSDGTSYSRKPAEVEARQHESLNDDLPLAR